MTPSRFLVVAMPSPIERVALEDALLASGLKARLQGTMFDQVNWHQTLSGQFFDQDVIESLKLACANVRAQACTLTFDRIRCDRGHWAFRTHDEPPSFTALLGAVKKALAAEGQFCLKGHSPHITISYCAPPERFTHKIRPIRWIINEILLVEGHCVDGREEHYRYDVIDRWPLQPQERPRQRNLFD